MPVLDRKHTCFVVMPFGEKKDLDGQDIDFDDIYRFFFKKAVESLGITCIRCDEIAESGSIHEKMFQHIFEDDIVVVDITTGNPNVFYELGVRHALAQSVTVLIRRKGTNIPFNIQGLQVVEYDQNRFGSIERAKDRIVEIIKNGLRERRNDSPVYAVLPLEVTSEKKTAIAHEEICYEYVADKRRHIGVLTGDLRDVHGIDAWVNSENTNLQMDRLFENTISGIIRYLGAKKEKGQIIEDTIAIELQKELERLDRTSVNAGEVVVTIPGELSRTHEVKILFHVASMIGQIGQGYLPIPYVGDCVSNVLRTLDDMDRTTIEIHSILFPLIGAHTSRGSLESAATQLITAALNYYKSTPETIVDHIYFLAYDDREVETCLRLLDAHEELHLLASPRPTPNPAASSGDPPAHPSGSTATPAGASTATTPTPPVPTPVATPRTTPRRTPRSRS